MSTYSSNLRIELITTGTQAGTWGTTTNDNLSTVLEQAVAGNVAVTTVASSQALTYLNGPTSTASANQSVRAILTLNTTTGADFAVYAPPVSKQYTIYNASSYTVTIYNSTVIGNTTAAGTGVAIPTGKTVTVWSDGTNFAQQNTYLNAPALVSPAMSGTPTAPTAAYGTNNTLVATTAFVQAALQFLYPVGTIYTSTSSTNPGTTFGFGTWTAFGAGRVLIGAGTNGGQTFAGGDTGGTYAPNLLSHTHTGTTGTESANHTHGFSGTTGGQSADHSHTFGNGGVAGGGYAVLSNGKGSDTFTSGTSNDHTHNFSGTTTGISNNHTHGFTTDASSSGSQTTGNMQPYVTVYMWQRTA